MQKIYTLKSKVYIKKYKFDEIVIRLKNNLPESLDVRDNNSIHYLLRQFNWKTIIDLKTQDIVALKYQGEEWNSIANRALIVLSKFIEPGGFIQLVDHTRQVYTVYNFDKSWFTQTPLTKFYADLSSQEDVNELLSKVLDIAIKKGISKKELIKMFEDKLLKEYL
jgi:hypothetical protein